MGQARTESTTQTAPMTATQPERPRREREQCAMSSDALAGRLTMRLSDAGLRQRQTKALYPNHRPPPWPNEDAPRDRSNRLLGAGGLESPREKCSNCRSIGNS